MHTSKDERPSYLLTLPSPRRRAASTHRPFRSPGAILNRTLQHGFARLVASEALVDIGILARVAAQSWVAYDLTGSSLWVGSVAAVRAVPSFISPAFTAIVANRFDHRLLIASMRAFIGILAIIQALLIGTGNMRPWHQMGLTLFTGLAIAIAGPAFLVFLRDELHPRLAYRASATIAFAHNSGEMIGPLTVGIIIALAGADWSFALIALLYFAGAYLILIVPLPEKDSVVRYRRVPYLTLLRIGMRHVRRNQPLPWLLVMLAATNLFGVAIFPLIPEYAIETFQSGGLGFGLMTGTIGAGFAIGGTAVAISGLHRNRYLILILTSLVWAAGSIAFAYSPNIAATLIILFIMGIANIVWSNAIFNLIKTHTPHSARDRVMSLYTIAMGLIPIGWAIGGAIATLASNEAALILAAISSLSITIAAYLSSPSLRRS